MLNFPVIKRRLFSWCDGYAYTLLMLHGRPLNLIIEDA